MIPPVIMPCLFCCAMASAMKTRLAGGHVTGAVVLGIVCGFLPGLVHRALMGEPAAAIFAMHPVVLAVVAGAVAGSLAGAVVAHNLADRVFFWVESLALGLTACVFADISFKPLMWDNPCTPALVALFAGLFCTLAPGFVRDVALGDTAAFVDESWHATAAALGIMFTLALRHLFPDMPTPLIEGVASNARPLAFYAPPLVGTLLVIVLRWRRHGAGLQS